MQAIVQTGSGGPEVLQLQTIPVPRPGRNQVLIRVYAAAVNPIDWKGRVEIMPGLRSVMTTARVPGVDVAGVIEQSGSGVSHLRPRAAVFAMIGRGGTAGLNGGYAEYVLAPAGNVIAKPRTLSFAQAAGLGMAAVTAARVVNQTNIGPGQRVLILGIAGGVGSSAAQIAKSRGAIVIGTATARHNAYLKSIGVDQVIDYSQVKFEEQVQNIDVVIDAVGGDNATRAIQTLKRGGTLISLAGTADAAVCAAAGVRCPSGRGGGPGKAAAFSEGELLEQVAALANAGKYTVQVDKTFALAQAGDAQEFNRDGHTEGKVIILIDAAKAMQR
jgi:NADPH:quinone reductase-like Zn-dependent oxidoreductase